MEDNLCWIGFEYNYGVLVNQIKSHLNKEIDITYTADEGIDAITEKEYPLIITSSSIPLESMDVPENIDRGCVGIDSYILGKIKEVRRETPLVMVHIGVFPGYDSREALRTYEDLGAVCFDSMEDTDPRRLPNLINQLL